MLLAVEIVSLLGGGAGAYLACAGLEQAWRLPGSAQDPRLVPLYLGAAVAALLSGQFFWWCFIVRPRHLTPERGMWVGAVSSLAAHPFAWLFALLATVVTGGTGANAWALPPEPSVVTILIYAGGYSLDRLIFVGWFTAVIGGLADWRAAESPRCWRPPWNRAAVHLARHTHANPGRGRTRLTAPHPSA